MTSDECHIGSSHSPDVSVAFPRAVTAVAGDTGGRLATRDVLGEADHGTQRTWLALVQQNSENVGIVLPDEVRLCVRLGNRSTVTRGAHGRGSTSCEPLCSLWPAAL